jgi:DNA-binding transcriptional LysR family regulator
MLKESSLTTDLEPVDNPDTRWQNVRTRLPSLTHLELGKGSWAMRKQSLELRHMRAIVMLAEDLSYTKVARRLAISQPAVTRTIQDAEERLGRKLFERNTVNVNLTDAGRKYVPEAKLALEHEERASYSARALAQNVEAILNIGRSQYIDPLLSDALLSVDLPFYPHLEVQLHSAFAPELAYDVLHGRLDLALITHPDFNPRLTTTKLMESPLHLLLSEDDSLAAEDHPKLADLSGKRWIVFDRRTHPTLYDSLFDHAHASHVEPRGLHHVMSAEEAGHLVHKNGGVAFLTRAGALRVAHGGLIARELDERDLCLDVHMAARADNKSKLVSEFVRTYVRLLKTVLLPPQMTLPIPTSVSR